MRDDIHNLADTVRAAAGSRPAQPALVAAGPGREATVTWAELDAQVDAVAQALLRLNLPRDGVGARVALALPNVPEFAVTLFGALRAGLVVVPVNPGYTSRELHYLLADSGTSVIIASAEVLDQLAPVRDQLPALAHVYGLGEPVAARPFADLTEPATATTATAGVPDAVGGGEDLAVLLYTSGTAGAPKGAMLSHRSLIANHRQLDGIEPAVVRPNDVILLALPLFHALGLNAGLGAIAWCGATGVLVERFEPEETLNTIERHRVSVVSAVPQMYGAWIRLAEPGPRLDSVRLAISGAAALDPMIARRFEDLTGHKIFEGYGLTETAPVLSTVLASPTAKTGSIGRPLPGVEVRLVGADGTHLALVTSSGLAEADFDLDFDDDAGDAPGTDPGEIVVRGENLFSGYWPDGSGGPDADGWWATGDIAYADADGDLFLVDRLGELIIVSGFNVYPREVELVLASLPGVAEAAVVGQDDAQTGQSVMAYVVPAPSGPAVSEQDLAAHCARNLARFKCPTAIEFMTELPHSATGKVLKSRLGAAS